MPSKYRECALWCSLATASSLSSPAGRSRRRDRPALSFLPAPRPRSCQWLATGSPLPSGALTLRALGWSARTGLRSQAASGGAAEHASRSQRLFRPLRQHSSLVPAAHGRAGTRRWGPPITHRVCGRLAGPQAGRCKWRCAHASELARSTRFVVGTSAAQGAACQCAQGRIQRGTAPAAQLEVAGPARAGAITPSGKLTSSRSLGVTVLP